MAKIKCPYCGNDAEIEGNKITCENCDAVYKITKEGARVQSQGRLDEHEKRIAALEDKIKPEIQACRHTNRAEQDGKPKEKMTDINDIDEEEILPR